MLVVSCAGVRVNPGGLKSLRAYLSFVRRYHTPEIFIRRGGATGLPLPGYNQPGAASFSLPVQVEVPNALAVFVLVYLACYPAFRLVLPSNCFGCFFTSVNPHIFLAALGSSGFNFRREFAGACFHSVTFLCYFTYGFPLRCRSLFLSIARLLSRIQNNRRFLDRCIICLQLVNGLGVVKLRVSQQQ
jgi:hypothetical protein